MAKKKSKNQPTEEQQHYYDLARDKGLSITEACALVAKHSDQPLTATQQVLAQLKRFQQGKDNN